MSTPSAKLMLVESSQISFPVNTGGLHGNVLSPMLFILLTDFVKHGKVEDGREGLDWISNRKLVNLEYGDDAVLINRAPQDLQSLLIKMQEISHAGALKINGRKTQMMRTEYALEDEMSLEREIITDVE
ncbi:uncharacterized protein [Palaemon carinicauda]|uniref:uncharacterized protein n=1 Tax=Palaemon carinicauda TaxID=392227 RepID=UPI0035B6982D